MQKRNLFVALALSLFFVACGGGLDGTWVKECDEGEQDYVTFEGENVTLGEKEYTENDCTGEVENDDVSQTGTFTEGEELEGIDGAVEIDLKITPTGGEETEIFQIYKVDGDTLLLGNQTTEKNGTSRETRPNELDEDEPYTRGD